MSLRWCLEVPVTCVSLASGPASPAGRSRTQHAGRSTKMSRSIRLYTPAQFEEVRTMVDLLAERSELAPAERDQLTAFQADLQQTVREDRRRASGTTRL